MPAISLVIPAYNEAERIVGTVNDALAYFDRRGLTSEIIVSADGTDRTRDLVRELATSRAGIVVIGSPERRGKGRGIREGIALATGDIIGFTDADNKTPIDDLDKVLPCFAAGADLVIGSRGFRDSAIERPQKLYRRIGSRGFSVFMHAAVGLRGIRDTQCGFKFFRADVARVLFARQQIDGYMYDVEILYLAKRFGYCLMQVPVRWRDDGDSRLDLVAGNIRNVRDVLSIRWMHRSAAVERLSAPTSSVS